ncbi:MAG: LPS translocon maturation chaperone LptM [Pseudolabrys sp.]
MIRSKYSRLAVTGVLVATLGLAACGRKGPLDPPPAASVAGAPAAGVGAAGDTAAQSGAPTPARKNIPLDVLLN